MPYRPIQHQIAEQATASVRQVWTSIGAAVEEVRRDYGEDLLVQTCLNGKMDAARLWVQVKGVQAAPRMTQPSGISSIRVRADTALRWARTVDLLLLVLWDVESDTGWYSIPDFFSLHGELALKSRESISFEVRSSDVFDATTAHRIAWYARLTHLAGFIRNFRRWQEEEQTNNGESPWVNEAVTEAVLDMMTDLGVLYVKGAERLFFMDPAFMNLFDDTLDWHSLPSKPNPDEVKDFLGRGLIAALLEQIYNATDGNPTTLAPTPETLGVGGRLGCFVHHVPWLSLSPFFCGGGWAGAWLVPACRGGGLRAVPRSAAPAGGAVPPFLVAVVLAVGYG